MKYIFVGISILILAYAITKIDFTFNLYVHVDFPGFKVEPFYEEKDLVEEI